MVMETAELVEELENRGLTVTRCEMQRDNDEGVQVICQRPSARHVSGAHRCEDCHKRITLSELREKYAWGTGDMRAKEQLVDAVHRGAMGGKAPEVIARWVEVTSGLSWRELCEVESEVLESRRMKLWIVGAKGSFGVSENVKLVLARSMHEARKTWRDTLYKNGEKNIPDRDDIVVTEVTGVTEPQVIADRPEQHLEFILGMHGAEFKPANPPNTMESLFRALFGDLIKPKADSED